MLLICQAFNAKRVIKINTPNPRPCQYIFLLTRQLFYKKFNGRKKMSYLLTVPLLYILGKILFKASDTSPLELCIEKQCEAFEDSSEGYASLLAQLLLTSPSRMVSVRAHGHRDDLEQTLKNMNFTSFHVE
jgi:hypothetical protein